MTQFENSITVVVPCYNEEAILWANLESIWNHMKSLESRYPRWEVLVVNDGSKDKTGEIADDFSRSHPHVRVIHHPSNLNLGNALKTGFRNAACSIIVVLDVDLSYGLDLVEKLSDTLVQNHADIVLASPYMKGGQVIAVPFTRKIMSKWVNRFMRFASQEKYHTFTGMCRAYRTSFIRNVNLKTKDYEINPEIMYKSMILRAKIVEIPARLDWTEQNKFAGKRTSSMRAIRGFFSGLMSGFIFRPYIFFWAVGTLLMILSLYELVWLLVDTLRDMRTIETAGSGFNALFSESLALNFKKNPQSFVVGGITFVVAIQFYSIGFLSLQNKRYFEELFHLGTHLRMQNEKMRNLSQDENS